MATEEKKGFYSKRIFNIFLYDFYKKKGEEIFTMIV